MTPTECPREHDVVAAILARRWPHQCDDALQAHATQCHVCRDLIDVMSLLREERDSLHEDVSVPAAGQVWWRAAVRARLEATQAAARPLTWLYGSAGACAIGLAVASIGLLWPPVQNASAWVSIPSWLPGLGLREAAMMIAPLAQTTGLLVLGAVACLVLAPLALYLALSDE